MIDLYYAATPNGLKLTMCLQEMQLEHRVLRVDIGRGEQFAPAFLTISPNNKIPALVDHAPDAATYGREPLALFESGAMLLYLAQKTGRFMPADARARMEVLKWLFWQVGGLGPMAGQNGHFVAHAPQPVPYALDRYRRETARLLAVLDRRLADREFIAGADYSIADMAAYPWVVPHRSLGHSLDEFEHLSRWFAAVAARPATRAAYVGVKDPYARDRAPMDDAQRAVLFGQK